MNCNEVSLQVGLESTVETRFQEFQREEMYCINKTDRYSQKLLARGCHALQWFEDKVSHPLWTIQGCTGQFSNKVKIMVQTLLFQVGCHSEQEDGSSITQCVCSEDLCNGPVSAVDVSHSTKTESFYVNIIFLLFLLVLLNDRRGKISYD